MVGSGVGVAVGPTFVGTSAGEGVRFLDWDLRIKYVPADERRATKIIMITHLSQPKDFGGSGGVGGIGVGCWNC